MARLRREGGRKWPSDCLHALDPAPATGRQLMCLSLRPRQVLHAAKEAIRVNRVADAAEELNKQLPGVFTDDVVSTWSDAARTVMATANGRIEQLNWAAEQLTRLHKMARELAGRRLS